jgi:SAM-dependent methyltransferase
MLVCEAQEYWTCADCAAIYLPPWQLPDAATEAAHYRLHRNSVDDPGYRRFLSTLADPLLACLPRPGRGLDFGCGPGPALAAMLEEAGHSMALYDPLFHPDPAPLQARYDFVTCSEVVEHLHDPAGTFARLVDLLAPGGVLAVMTAFPPDRTQFAAWHYRRDPTHVVFYSPGTLHALAERLGTSCVIPCANVALMQRAVHVDP